MLIKVLLGGINIYTIEVMTECAVPTVKVILYRIHEIALDARKHYYRNSKHEEHEDRAV